jgi:hypothetical protein
VDGTIEFIDLHRQLDEFNNLGCELDWWGSTCFDLLPLDQSIRFLIEGE